MTTHCDSSQCHISFLHIFHLNSDRLSSYSEPCCSCFLRLSSNQVSFHSCPTVCETSLSQGLTTLSHVARGSHPDDQNTPGGIPHVVACRNKVCFCWLSISSSSVSMVKQLTSAISFHADSTKKETHLIDWHFVALVVSGWSTVKVTEGFKESRWPHSNQKLWSLVLIWNTRNVELASFFANTLDYSSIPSKFEVHFSFCYTLQL